MNLHLTHIYKYFNSISCLSISAIYIIKIWATYYSSCFGKPYKCQQYIVYWHSELASQKQWSCSLYCVFNIKKNPNISENSRETNYVAEFDF